MSNNPGIVVDFAERQEQIRKNRLHYAELEQAEVMSVMAEQRKLINLPKSLFALIGSIFNPSVPMANRARGIDQSHWNTVKNWKSFLDSTDISIFKMGGMDIGDGKGALKVYEDDKWSANVQAVYDYNNASLGHKVRTEAYFYVHPNYHLLKQRQIDWVRNQDYKTNEVLIQVITSLHNGAWTWDTLNANSGWKPVEAVWFDVEETQAWNGKITSQWQVATLENLVDPMLTLQNRGFIPKDWIIGIYSRPLFLRDDCKDSSGNPMDTYLYNRRDRLYLWLAQWIWSLDPDIQLGSLMELWQKYLPVDTFKFLYVPYGMENRVFHHQFTGEKFDVPEYVPEVDGNLHFDTVEAYDKLTGFASIPTPPPPPPPPPTTDIEKRVAELEKQVAINAKDIADLKTWGSGINFK